MGLSFKPRGGLVPHPGSSMQLWGMSSTEQVHKNTNKLQMQLQLAVTVHVLT